MNYPTHRLSEILRSGEKKTSQFKIGVEIEHFVVDKNSWTSINYYQEAGIETILKKLLKFDYTPLYEETHLIGLEREDAVITIEPGGQLEISIKACHSLQEIDAIYWNFLQEVIPILEEQHQFLVMLGYHPKSKISEIPFIPKKRYQLMSAYLQQKGTCAHNMMKGTAALQVTIDYQHEDDFIKKMKVANFLSPFLAMLTDNSPVFEGEIYRQNLLRSWIWQHTDAARCGIIPGILDKPFGYQEYAEYLLNIEPILFVKDNHIINAGSLKNAALLTQYPLTPNELVHLFSMVFPVARARTYIEIRPADSLPYPFNFSYIALIKGLFYHDAALEYLFGLTKTTDAKQLETYAAAIAQHGFSAALGSKTVMEFLAHLFNLASAGLPAEEKAYLRPLETVILSQQNIADIAKERLATIGLTGLRNWTANDWILEGKSHVDTGII